MDDPIAVSEHQLSAEEKRAALEAATRRGLLPAAVGLGVVYVVMVVLHTLDLPEPQALPSLVASALSAAGFFGVAMWFRSRRKPLSRVDLIAGLFGLVVLFNVAFHYAHVDDPAKGSTFLVLQIGAGALYLSLPWLVVILSGSYISWFTLTLLYVPHAPLTNYGGFLLGTTAAAVLIHVVRVRTVVRLEKLRRHAEMQRVSAEHSLATAQEAERALERARSDLQRIIETSTDAIFIHSQGRIRYANLSLASCLRHDGADDLVGGWLADLVEPVDRIALMEHSTPGENKRLHAIFRFVRRTGETVVLDVAPAQRIEYGGEPAALITARDVTEQHEDMRARLMTADRMLAIGTLAAGVAHEINNPAAWVIANLSTLDQELNDLGDKLTPELRDDMVEMVTDSLEGARRIQHIVEDMRTFSAQDDERKAFVAVHELLQTAIKMANKEIRTRAKLVKKFVPLPVVVANKARLGQVFLNLLVNAAQSLPEGHPDENTITVTASHKPSGPIQVEIRDTGPGMSEETLRRAFDPFYTTKPVGEGTGLGLFFCRNVMVDLGGEIALVSEEGQGTSVLISLPVAEGAEGAEEAALPQPPDGRSWPDPTKRASLLVVDDEPAIGRMLRRQLRGHDVTVVSSGREAIEQIRTKPFDVILCDLSMQDMTGIQIFEEVQASYPGYINRFIVMTGGAHTRETSRFIEETACPVLDKPIDRQQLLRLIEEMAGKAGEA